MQLVYIEVPEYKTIMKKNVLFLIIFTCQFFFLNAKLKNVEVPGYYITAAGDSVKGKFLMPKQSAHFDSVIPYFLQFKAKFIHADGKTKKIRPRSGVKEVGYWINGVPRRYHRVHNGRVMKHGAPGGRYTFAHLLIDGKIEVHGLIRRAGILEGDMNFENDHVIYKKGTRKRFFESKFDNRKKKIKRFVKDCPDAYQFYKTHDFILISELYTLIDIYNKCK
jgi:hypothetical protein